MTGIKISCKQHRRLQKNLFYLQKLIEKSQARWQKSWHEPVCRITNYEYQILILNLNYQNLRILIQILTLI